MASLGKIQSVKTTLLREIIVEIRVEISSKRIHDSNDWLMLTSQPQLLPNSLAASLTVVSTMLSRTASTLLRRSAARHMSTEAASASKSMTLNFSLPHETLYSGASVASVIIPGVEGEYGVTMDHVPIVSQLKPGVLQILHEDGETEKYFVSGGFALTHPNSVTVRAIQ